jgi:hypothetical protein
MSKIKPTKERKNLISQSLIKLGLAAILVFISYLIILPLINQLLIPCLDNHPFVSYNDKECTVLLGLDTYMKLALTGFGLITIGFWVILKRYLHLMPSAIRLISIMIITSVMAISLIISYQIYIPAVESAVRAAPILLETAKK